MSERVSVPRNSLIERACRAIVALRTPDASLARVPNTVRQSIADVIEEMMPSAFRSSKRAQPCGDCLDGYCTMNCGAKR